ncbi:MAG: sulfite exporter TauE/SafE family protein [Thermoflexales bacterium]|nr:sulfite exporter TauE/SafE family protein [Thermoflexales bacterium]
MEIIIAFITGLTAGGLSCLAVQGGLLASSVAYEVESSFLQAKNKHSRRPQARASRPILLFLGAKLVAYTLLGFLLGWLGSVMQLAPMFHAILQLAIGVFMIGTALRMLNVHPIFRYFAVEPPSFVTRYIRRTAKDGSHLVTPLFLGTLTVLIPCGVTQAMMAVAIGTGNPLMGAAIMAAFTLGTSPVFFTVAYLATQLGARLESNFMRLVAVVVLVLGIVSIDTSLNLMGSPYSSSNLIRSFSRPVQARDLPQQFTPITPPGVSTPPATAAVPQATLTIHVVNSGYEPATLQAKANQALRLKLVTNKTYSCTRAFVIPALNINRILPATGTESVDIPPQRAGSVLYFSCSMGMYGGQIEFN